ncbi:TonB-dependent receptor [uncultured Mucilaginibacter sp.]|uniref:TonB-dependent receptor domain-containing protein n=1 Tax=uncultured Mucilaginibacter sp. TaxID=797541 RepID=UPI0025EDF780|nr:TonB-dependent receptor [uncultured Mucilaginibacter sp.]
MKRFFTLIALLTSFVCAKAQIPGAGSSGITGRISGTVIDSLSKKPLDYATISLYRSGGKAVLNGTLTDDKGTFKLNNIAPGKYKVAVTFIGYPTKFIDPVETTPGKPDINMGNIIVSPGAKTLGAVTVTGQAPVIENKIDKIVYNAEKDITSAGGNATDVLRKVPLVSVDLDGKPSLRGDQNVRVLINGKPSGALSTSLADVLRTIPADQIKSIEVITSPSAKYDAEGSGGIINIITKTKDVSGLSGSVSGGIGTRQNNGNANLNYKQNRFSLTGNIGSNFAWPQTSLFDLNSVRDLNGRTNTVVQSSRAETKRYGTIGSVTAGYDVNNYNSLSTTFRVNGGGFQTDGSGDNAFDLRKYTSTNYNKVKFSGFDWNADYTRKFKKEGEELTVAGQWSHSKLGSDYNAYYFNVDPNDFPNQIGNNDGVNDEYTAQVDYALPVTKSFKLEAGGKSIFRDISSNYDVYQQFDASGNVTNTGPFTLSNRASNKYDYSQNVYAGYTVLTFTLPKNYSLQAGARVENTVIEGVPSNSTQTNLQPFTQNYTTFVPSFILSKTVKGTQTYKLSYNKRIQRPSLQYLNPFINKANNQSQTEGNPTLSPEITQTVELGYNTFIGSSVINLSTYYKYTNNLIEGINATVEDPELAGDNNPRGLTSRTTFQNIGTNKSFGASFFGSITPWKPLTIRGSVNAFTYRPTVNQNQSANQGEIKTYFNYNAFLSASATITKTWTAEFFGVFNSPRRTIQGQNPAFNLFGFGVKKELIAKKFTLGLNALSPFQTYLKLDSKVNSPTINQTTKIRYPLQSFGISFTYNFGKLTYGQQKKKGVKNDDLMQGGDQGGMGGGGGQGGGPR